MSRPAAVVIFKFIENYVCVLQCLDDRELSNLMYLIVISLSFTQPASSVKLLLSLYTLSVCGGVYMHCKCNILPTDRAVVRRRRRRSRRILLHHDGVNCTFVRGAAPHRQVVITNCHAMPYRSLHNTTALSSFPVVSNGDFARVTSV